MTACRSMSTSCWPVRSPAMPKVARGFEQHLSQTGSGMPLTVACGKQPASDSSTLRQAISVKRLHEFRQMVIMKRIVETYVSLH